MLKTTHALGLAIFALLLFVAGLPEARAVMVQNRVWENSVPLPQSSSGFESQAEQTQRENSPCYDESASGREDWTSYDPEGLQTIEGYQNSNEELEGNIAKLREQRKNAYSDDERDELTNLIRSDNEQIHRNNSAIAQIEDTARWQNERVTDAVQKVIAIGDGADALRGAQHFVNAGDLDDASAEYKGIQSDRTAMRALGVVNFVGTALLLHNAGGSPTTGDAALTTVFRVEGAANTRILIGENGQVMIMGDKMLFLNFGDKARAEQFLAQRLSGGMSDTQIKSFQVSQSFLDDIRKEAVPQSMAKQFPGRPQIVDPTKAPDQFGLKPDQIERLKDAIMQGSGQVH